MNLITATVVGAAALTFGPGFVVKAGAMYVASTLAGSYTKSQMKRLHNEICERTGDDKSAIDDLSDYAMKSCQVAGLFCPAIPAVSAGVGMYCSQQADRLTRRVPRRNFASAGYGCPVKPVVRL